ncbi:MAG: hypothetical protein RR387_06685 [Clostridiales bacterium]
MVEQVGEYRPWLCGSVVGLSWAEQVAEIENRLAAEYRRCRQNGVAMLKINIRVALQIGEELYQQWLAPPEQGETEQWEERRALLLKWQDMAEQLTMEFACQDKKGSIGAFAAKAVFGYGEKEDQGMGKDALSIEEFLQE